MFELDVEVAWKRSEFAVARYARKSPLPPIPGRLVDAILGRGDKVPLDVPLFRERLAAENNDAGWRYSGDDDLGPRLEDYEAAVRKRSLLSADGDSAAGEEDRPLDVFAVDPVPSTPAENQLSVEELGELLGRGPAAMEAACQQFEPDALAFDRRYLVSRDVLKPWFCLFMFTREGDPALETKELRRSGALSVASPFGVNDAAARDHHVHLTRADRLNIAFAITMDQLAVDEIRKGGQPDVRIGARVDSLSGFEGHRPEAIEENERADHAPHGRRKRSTDFEPTKVPGVRKDNPFDFRIREVSHVFHPVNLLMTGC